MGLIGLGGISESHIRTYLSMQSEVTLQAAAESNKNKLHKICDHYNIPERYDNPLDLIRMSNIDAL
jgi:predicted dehydrogenase